MVVGWCIGGGVDNVNTHRGKTIGTAAQDRVALLATFLHAAFSYWTSVFPRVCVYIVRWRRRARRIPDPVLRQLAFDALAKRGNIEGAAAFAAFVPARRRAAVTRATSAFQAAYNLLDMLGEQPSPDPVLDGQRLHEALLYAVTPRVDASSLNGSGPTRADAHEYPQASAGDIAPVSRVDPREQQPIGRLDWYEHHPQRNDGGYLDALIDECRDAFAGLPSHLTAAPAAQAAAVRIVAFQSLNLSKSQGEHTGLEHWALAATPQGTGLQWWETAAAAGSSLGVHVLMAAAADPLLDSAEVSTLANAYFPWIGGLHSLLDNLIDKHEDEAAGHRSLIEYYGPEQAAERMRWIAQQALRRAQELPHSRGQVAILAAMIGNYLATPEAHSPELKPVSDSVLATVGALRRPTMLVFELRRLPTRLHDRFRRPADGAQAQRTTNVDIFR
jgi:tetraprenyl-beta-curcumene synthase